MASGDGVASRLALTIALSIVGKLLGFVRLQQTAVLLGVGTYSDVALIALQLIWLVEVVLISGAAVPILVARIYKIDSEEGGAAAFAFFLHAAMICAALAATFGVAMVLLPEQIAWLVAPGLDAEGRALLRELLLYSAVTPLALTMLQFVSLVNRLLQNGAWYSLNQVISNGASVAGLVAGHAAGGLRGGAAGMMIGLLLGTVAVGVAQFAAIPRRARPAPIGALRSLRYPAGPYWRGVAALVLVTFVGEAYVYVDFYFASGLEAGSVSAIAFAGRLATLTNMLLVTTAFVVLEPRWANALAAEGSRAWTEVIGRDAMTVTSLLAAPICILFVFPSEVNALVYRADGFAPEDRARLDELTEIFAWAVLGMGLTFITARALIVAGHQRWLAGATVAVLPAKVLLNLYLTPIHGTAGLATATTVSFGLQALANAIGLAQAGLLGPMGRPADPIRLAACLAACLPTAFALRAILPEGTAGLLAAIVVIGAVNISVGSALGFGYRRFLDLARRR